MKQPTVAIVGGGAAGYFAAIHCAENLPNARVVLLEGTQRPLTKVRISGGGRCNVTHHCFDPAELVKAYPRGHRELRGPFSRFQPKDTIAWFEGRGVRLKVEPDGRMFPTTDDSATIADCLIQTTIKAGVEIRLGAVVKAVARGEGGGFLISLRDAQESFDAIIFTTGSAPSGHEMIRNLGHTIVSAVPSLFTFNITDPRLAELPGIAFERAKLQLQVDAGDKTSRFEQVGPLLITHWGLSGPAVLKLSAWAARSLFDAKYQATLKINFIPSLSTDALIHQFVRFKEQHPKKALSNECPAEVPKRFWRKLVELAGISESETWANLPKTTLQSLARELTEGTYQVSGKGVFKDEFVTCGGVALNEVDFRTMQSRLCPGLFFAGEVLDIDGITGGFNFQNAWTTAFIAAQGVEALLSQA
jgi:predicted Rossmann fold flavoprotein